MSHHTHDRIEHDVKITVVRCGDHTEARAKMHWRHTDLVGVGKVDIDPDPRFPERVGDELATARALTHLRRQMFVTTPGDVVAVAEENV